MKETLVTSDIDPLRQVIVQHIGPERKHVLPKFSFVEQYGFTSEVAADGVEAEHREFVETLRKSGAGILFTYDLIQSALMNIRKEGKFTDWLSNNFPNAIKFAHDNFINAADLVGASDRAYFNFEGNEHKPLFRPLMGMFYTRDWATVLPEGVVLTAFNNKRKTETKLARLIFEYSDQLRDIPIIFDAEKEDVYLQGGDLIVLNKETLLLGVNNLSDKNAASRLAKNLNKTVIGVALPSMNSQNPLGSMFLHLDSAFNLVDRDKALVVPYFFEDKYAQSNPFYSILESTYPIVSDSTKQKLIGIVKDLENVGRVSIFEASTGKEKETKTKLVDFLSSHFGYQMIPVGGDIPESFSEQARHIVESVLPEVRFQAANVVAIKPGQVVIFKENTLETRKALEEAGIGVFPVEAKALTRWSGGPHCMTLPISRGI